MMKPLFIGLGLFLLQAGCHRAPEMPATSFTTSVPVFASIIRGITGPDATIHVLVTGEQSPHGYRPRPSDAVAVSRSRSLILGAPDLDGWAENLSSSNVVYLSGLLPANRWMETNGTRNIHFWMDPLNIEALIDPLSTYLCRLNADSCQMYRSNAARFRADLLELSRKIQLRFLPLTAASVIESTPFADYLLVRSGIRISGVLELVTGAPASPAHLAKVFQTVKRENVAGVVAVARNPNKTTQMFAEETGLSIAYLDPVGVNADSTYVSLIERNVDSLYQLIQTHNASSQ